MKNIKLSLMEINDIKTSAEVLSKAMLDNLIHIAVLKGNGEKERRELEKMFTDLLKNRPGITFVAKDQDKIIGVMRMKSCTGGSEVEEPDNMDFEDTGYRKYIWFKNWAENDPAYQHWHLGPIGVLPQYRRKGIGSMLMDRFIAEVDACGAKAYLETDLDENVIFYRKSGFEIVKRDDILGVESRFMERPALIK